MSSRRLGSGMGRRYAAPTTEDAQVCYRFLINAHRGYAGTYKDCPTGEGQSLIILVSRPGLLCS